MHNLWGNIFKHQKSTGIRAILEKIPLFDTLAQQELSAIERILHKRSYEAGEHVFRQGEPGMGMYIIEHGEVTILTEHTSHVLAELGEGEFFGELSLLDESPRSATAIAKTRCSIFGFFQPDLIGLIERNPRLGVKIVMRLASVIGDRLRKANENIVSATRPV